MILSNFKSYYEILFQTLKDEKSSIDVIQAQLLTTLQKQMQNMGNNEDVREGLYLQVALSDELFLEKKFSGWKDKMLEHQIFHTQNAGERIGDDLEKVIRDPLTYDRELIYVFFLTLSLGFKGKFSGSVLQKYKMHLSRVLFPEGDQMEYLMSGNFHFTEKKPAMGFVPDVRLWLKILTGLLVIYVIATSVYWWSVQKEMHDIVDALDRHTKVEVVR